MEACWISLLTRHKSEDRSQFMYLLLIGFFKSSFVFPVLTFRWQDEAVFTRLPARAGLHLRQAVRRQRSGRYDRETGRQLRGSGDSQSVFLVTTDSHNMSALRSDT